MGADRKLANWDKLHEYYQLLAKSSNRVKLVELGKTSEGRPVHRALHLVAREPREARSATADQRAACRPARPVARRKPRSSIADGKAVIIQSFALHSTEVAAAQTAAEFVYDCLTRNDEEAQRILDNVISIVMPSINPDGRRWSRDWYHEVRRHAVRGVEPAVALPEVLRATTTTATASRSNLPESQYHRQADVSRVDAAGLRRSSPDGQRQRAHRTFRRTRSRSGRTAIRWCGARSPGAAATWAPSSKPPARPA